jgi:hypothetical protein
VCLVNWPPSESQGRTFQRKECLIWDQKHGKTWKISLLVIFRPFMYYFYKSPSMYLTSLFIPQE